MSKSAQILGGLAALSLLAFTACETRPKKAAPPTDESVVGTDKSGDLGNLGPDDKDVKDQPAGADAQKEVPPTPPDEAGGGDDV